ncbi:MAG: hypothetical protein HXY34_09620 [Candidatus Thorarchaeota archaeon]|nr:hypothetical protein [Candidatus Thorarchaeota archaeon]
MKATRRTRAWDRVRLRFVDVFADRNPDFSMPCAHCRFYDATSRQCRGVGSAYYTRRVPFDDFIPRADECTVRLPPELTSYIQ